MKKFSFMSKIKLNNAPKKLFLMKQIALLLVTASILIFAVFAWFATNETATANGIHISMEAQNAIKMSLDNGEHFLSKIDLLGDSDQDYIDENHKILNKLRMLDITSDGKSFLWPVFKIFADNRTPDLKETWSDAEKNRAYITQEIIFRTTEPSYIYLSDKTQIITFAESEKSNLVGNNVVNQSTQHGNFSKDCIVGALRLSVVDSENELLYIYIPRKDIEMIKDPSSPNTYIVKTGSDVNSDVTSVHTYFEPVPEDEVVDGILYREATINPSTDTDKTVLINSLGVDNSSPIAVTSKTEDGNYEATATINIWLEGCDAETTRALSGGQYSINLNFEAITYEVETTTMAAE